MLEALKVAHMVGIVVLGLALVAVWVLDLTGRRARSREEEAARRVAPAYDAVVIPGALLMLASGGGMIAAGYGSTFLDIPWLAGMVILFLLKFVRSHTITRLLFRRLRRGEAPRRRGWLQEARGSLLPSFTHFLDIPVFVLIMYLGVFKPTDWSTPVLGFALAVAAALAQTMLVRTAWKP